MLSGPGIDETQTDAEAFLSGTAGKSWARNKMSNGSYIFTSKTPIVKGDFKSGQKIDVYRVDNKYGREPTALCVNKAPTKSGFITIDRGAICDIIGYDKPYFDLLSGYLYLDGTNEGFSDDIIIVKPRSFTERNFSTFNKYLGDNRYSSRRDRSWNPSNGGRKRTARRQQQKQRRQQKTRKQRQQKQRRQQKTRRQQKRMQ